MATAELTCSIVEASGAVVRPLRVCHVSLTLKTGGLERLLVDIARCHNPEATTTEFVALSEVGRFADEIRQTGCQVHSLSPAGRLGRVSQMVRLFRGGKFDVVHTHNTYPHIFGSIAARLAGVPVVVNTRHGQRAGHGWKSRVQFRWASHLVDRIVAVSDDAARLCVETDRVAPRKVIRIWNGIDIDNFTFAGPTTIPVAISVTRLPRKRTLHLCCERCRSQDWSRTIHTCIRRSSRACSVARCSLVASSSQGCSCIASGGFPRRYRTRNSFGCVPSFVACWRGGACQFFHCHAVKSFRPTCSLVSRRPTSTLSGFTRPQESRWSSGTGATPFDWPLPVPPRLPACMSSQPS